MGRPESGDWVLWSDQRPTDTRAAYRWRVPERVICGLPLRPEWTEKLALVGMGYEDNEWWPLFSNWNGWVRSVPAGLEWRPADERETEITWAGLDLLPCPHSGGMPKVSYHGRWIGAPPYLADYLILHTYFSASSGWRDAGAMQRAWNTRTPHYNTETVA